MAPSDADASASHSQRGRFCRLYASISCASSVSVGGASPLTQSHSRRTGSSGVPVSSATGLLSPISGLWTGIKRVTGEMPNAHAITVRSSTVTRRSPRSISESVACDNLRPSGMRDESSRSEILRLRRSIFITWATVHDVRPRPPITPQVWHMYGNSGRRVWFFLAFSSTSCSVWIFLPKRKDFSDA